MELTQDQLNQVTTKLHVVVEKAKNLPDGQFEAVLSTASLDRHGEHVSITGMTIPKDRVFKMYYNHQTYGDSLPIGKWIKVWKSGGKLMGRGEIDMEDDFAVKVYKKILGGFIDSISVGFYPQEFDGENSTWTKSELVEASVVAEPANPEALITSKQLGFTEKEFEKSLKVRLKNVEEDGEEEEPDQPKPDSSDSGATELTEVKSAIETLKSKVGALEAAAEAANEDQTMKTLIKVRLAGKSVDKAAEKVNTVIKVKLKETNDATTN